MNWFHFKKNVFGMIIEMCQTFREKKKQNKEEKRSLRSRAIVVTWYHGYFALKQK